MPHISRSLNTQPLGGKDNMGETVSVGTDSESPRSHTAIVSVEHQASTNSCFKTQGPFGDQPPAAWERSVAPGREGTVGLCEPRLCRPSL